MRNKTIIEEVDSSAYDASEKPFDFVEQGVETALLCEPDPAIRSKIITALYNMGYHTTAPQSHKDTLKQMRFHVFDMVVLNERFGTRDPDMNSILKYLDRLNISIRRNIFLKRPAFCCRYNVYLSAIIYRTDPSHQFLFLQPVDDRDQARRGQ